MATPTNPLDIFVTYTPHYELHLSDNWGALAAVKTVDINAQTTPKNSNGTLLINTRKDAHQHIDNIKFMYQGPLVDPSGSLCATGDVSMDIIEPNGTSFIEKIYNRFKSLNITNYAGGGQYGLKIFFVGRMADGSEKTIPFGNIIPLSLINLEAKYSQRGGEYHLKMVITSSAVGSTPLQPDNGIARAMGFVNKNISFKATTVQEAITLLEEQLNKNYKDVYANELLNASGAKEIKYKIELDSKITGSLNLVTKDSLAKGEKTQLTFTPSIDIGTMIRKILMSSKDVLDMIGKSKEGIGKEGHPGVKLPVLQTFYHLDTSVVNLIYRVNLYEGGDTGDTFEFDYYFSGKNVDVLEFEVKFNQMQIWLATSINSVELNRNADGKIPSLKSDHWCANVVPEDKTCKKQEFIPNDRKSIPAKSGDPAMLPGVPQTEMTGFAKYEVETVPVARQAFETLGQASGSTNNQVTFTIRGHLQLLDRVVFAPDGSGKPPSGVKKSTWIKVNIFDKDGNKFFYTGKYILSSIENIFSGGKFLQNLTVQMMEPSKAAAASTPTVAPNTNTRQGQ